MYDGPALGPSRGSLCDAAPSTRTLLRPRTIPHPDNWIAMPTRMSAATLKGPRFVRTQRRRSSRAAGAGPAPRVSVVIPTLDEAANLPHVFARMPDVFEVIVVDGHSTDSTIEVARAL